MFQSVAKCFMTIEAALWDAECIQLWDKCHNKMAVKGLELLSLSQKTSEKVSRIGFVCVVHGSVWICFVLFFCFFLFIYRLGMVLALGVQPKIV